MSVPDADTLIRLAEILEVSVSELLGTKIENENVASDVAEQLSRINEQLAIKNRRSRRIWKIVAIILAVIVLVNIFIAVFFSVPDLNSNTQNNPLAISDETISIDILVGDYYIPDLKLPEEHRPIGKYGRMHREYLREVHPARLNTLTLTGELWTYLADLNEQAQERLDTIMEQMKATEGVTEELKRTRQMEWVQRCNNIHNRAEEIVLHDIIYSYGSN